MEGQNRNTTSIIKLIKNCIHDFMDKECTKLSASLAYYTTFALPSFAIFLISFLGLFLKEDEVADKLFLHINKLLGTQVTNQIQEIVTNKGFSASNILETVVGLATLLYSASGMFSEVQSSINEIWNIKSKPKKNFLRVIVDQFLSFSMIGIFGLILVISLFIDSFIEIFYHKLAVKFNVEEIDLANSLDLIVVYVIVNILFCYIFKELPDAKIRLKDAFVGALFTSTLFMIGKWLIGVYLDYSQQFELYGSAGSILILLFWVYYSALILYFGAIFTKNYASMYGVPIQPDEFSEFNTAADSK